jgi:hypothetical protein
MSIGIYLFGGGLLLLIILGYVTGNSHPAQRQAGKTIWGTANRQRKIHCFEFIGNDMYSCLCSGDAFITREIKQMRHSSSDQCDKCVVVIAKRNLCVKGEAIKEEIKPYSDEVTDKQVHFLKKIGVKAEDIPKSKYEASDMITQLLEKK